MRHGLGSLWPALTCIFVATAESGFGWLWLRLDEHRARVWCAESMMRTPLEMASIKQTSAEPQPVTKQKSCIRGLSGKVHIFHRRGPPSPSLGISVLSEGLSSELVVCSQYGQELVVWFGPATN